MEHSLATPNRERSGIAAFLHPLVERRTYFATIDLLLDLAFGILWFTLFTTMIATGVGTFILLVGPPLLVATLLLARAGGWFERRRTRLLLGTSIADPVRRPGKGKGVLQKLVTPIRDRAPWKELFYLWLVQPVLSIANFTIALVAWVVPLWAITLPIYALEWKGAAPQVTNGWRLDTPHEVVPTAIAGLLVLPLTPWIIRGLARFDSALARVSLSPSRTGELEERVDMLRETPPAPAPPP